MADTSLMLAEAAQALSLQSTQLDVVRSAVGADLNDGELALYLWQCQRYGFDPLLREAYAFRAGGKMAIGVGIDGLRKRAASTGEYRPGPVRYDVDEKGSAIAAHVTVGRYHRETGTWIDCEASAYLSDMPVRSGMTRVILAKRAEAMALRRLFPAETGGIYERSEMDFAREDQREASSPLTIEVTAEPVPPAEEHRPTETARATVLRMGKVMGADRTTIGRVVTALHEAGRIPKLAEEWTDEHVNLILGEIEKETKR